MGCIAIDDEVKVKQRKKRVKDKLIIRRYSLLLYYNLVYWLAVRSIKNKQRDSIIDRSKL